MFLRISEMITTAKKPTGYDALLPVKRHVEPEENINLPKGTEFLMQLVGPEPGKPLSTKFVTVRIWLKFPTTDQIIVFRRIDVMDKHVARYAALRRSIPLCFHGHHGETRKTVLRTLASASIIDVAREDPDNVRMTITVFGKRASVPLARILEPIFRSKTLHSDVLLGAITLP